MDHRAPRLGDIVDDYCPRERRITNHAIVAIVEDAIRQTRCTTCDAEHVFRQGREPRKRKTTDSAFDEVLASVTGGERMPPRTAEPVPAASAPVLAAPVAAAPRPEPATGVGPTPEPAPAASAAHDEHVSAHRQLIRAALPKTESDVPAPRAIPEFTMHQRPSGRGGGRSGRGPGHEVDGNSTAYVARDYRASFHGQGSGNGASRGQYRGGRPDGGGHGHSNGIGNGNGHGSGSGPDRQGGHARSTRRRGRHKREQ